MNFFGRTRGSVTIFLVIILVPVLVISSLFVDASRMRLAQAMASSAGDLALNTVLTQYDVELNDYYGMMASAQNMDEFLEASEKYFEACMVSRGVESTYARDFAKQLIDMVKGEEVVNDLMAVNLEDTNVNIALLGQGTPNEATMANPAIVKQQMVEFMKYRAPIEGITEFLGSLTSIAGNIDIKPIENAETAEKQDYYEAESKLLEAAYDMYKEMCEYQNLGVNDTYIEELRNYMDGLCAEYEDLHRCLVKNWYNSDDCQDENFKLFQTRINTSPGCSDYNSSKKAGIGTIKNKFKDFEEKVEEYNTAKNTLQAKIDAAAIPVECKDDVYDIQYWVQWTGILNDGKAYENYVKAANKLFAAYDKMNNAYDNRKPREEEEVAGTKEDPILGTVNVYKTVEYDYADDEYKDGKTYGEYHAALVDKMKEIKEQYDSWDLRKITEKVEEISTKEENKNAISHEIATQRLSAIAAKLVEYEDKLAEAEQKLTEIDEQAKNLATEAATYESEFNEWYGVTQQITNEQATESTLLGGDKQEAESVAESRETDNSPAATIKAEHIEALRSRLQKMITLIRCYKEAIRSYQYRGKEVAAIDKYSEMKNIQGIEETSISVWIVPLDSYSDSSFQFNVAPDAQRPAVTEQNSPDLDKPNPEAIKLWSWLKEKFKDMDEAKKEDKKGVLDNLRKIGDSAKKESENDAPENLKDISSENINGVTSLPSKMTGVTADDTKESKSSTAGDNSNAVKDLFEGFHMTDLNNLASSMRDNLYCTMYIMNMFSYDTYNMEGKYNLLTDGSNNSDTSSSKYKTSSSYDSGNDLNLTSYKSLYALDDVVSAWKNEATIFSENKTLTNHWLANGQQFSFGNEVEYILYGGDNKSNKMKSYATIYAMRYAFDLMAVYKEYYTWETDAGAFVNTLAEGIQTATCEIIPAVLVKVVIVLGVTAAEAATDLMYLKAGMPVLLFKTEGDDLFLSFSFDGSTGGSSSETRTGIIGEGLYWQYSDYLFLFTFLGVSGNGKADAMYKRVADVMQCNMAKSLAHITDPATAFKPDDSQYRLNKSYVYYEIKADIKVNPLLTATPLSRSEGTDFLDTSSWNMFTYSTIRGY